MKLYVISGLGADFKVLERLVFPETLDVIFLDWLMPERNEPFSEYVKRMSEKIDDSERFSLLGYSFGGILVQEINKIKPAEKVVILGSIKSHHEKSKIMKFGEFTGISKLIPQRLFNEKTTQIYMYLRKFFYKDGSNFLTYFQVRNPYYLKWSIERISSWKSEKSENVIQILADKDIVFPIKNSKPDYMIQNASHLFPATKHKQVSLILKEIFDED